MKDVRASSLSRKEQAEAAMANAVREWDDWIRHATVLDLPALDELHSTVCQWVQPCFVTLPEMEFRQRDLYVRLTSITMMAVAAELERRHLAAQRGTAEARPSWVRLCLRWPLKLFQAAG